MPILPTDPGSGSGGVSSGAGAVGVGLNSWTADGLKTSFQIPHGLGYTPTHVTITSKNILSDGDKYLTYDATYITINFSVAPTNGTIQFSWGAFK